MQIVGIAMGIAMGIGKSWGLLGWLVVVVALRGSVVGTTPRSRIIFFAACTCCNAKEQVGTGGHRWAHVARGHRNLHGVHIAMGGSPVGWSVRGALVARAGTGTVVFVWVHARRVGGARHPPAAVCDTHTRSARGSLAAVRRVPEGGGEASRYARAAGSLAAVRRAPEGGGEASPVCPRRAEASRRCGARPRVAARLPVFWDGGNFAKARRCPKP